MIEAMRVRETNAAINFTELKVRVYIHSVAANIGADL
jgi:hypothetical protein